MTNTPNMKASEFAAHRATLGLSLKDMAALVGVSMRAVQHYEAGTRPVSRPVANIVTTAVQAKAAGQ